MEAFDKAGLREALKSGRVEWRKHALVRMLERNIRRRDVVMTVVEGECIEEYASDAPFPSGLFLGWIDQRPLHVVAAYDSGVSRAFVITAYEPSLEHFEPDFKTRRSL